MQRWKGPIPFGPSGGELTLAGIALLMASLVVRHVEALRIDGLAFVTSWSGAILVVVGLGKILFLEGPR